MPTAASKTDTIVRRSFIVMIALLGVCATVIFIPLMGTTDVDEFWVKWTQKTLEYGLREGYAQANTDYPPGSFILLFLIAKVSTAMGASLFLGLKTALAATTVLSAALIGWWSRNPLIGIATLFALLLNTVAQAYLDVFLLPFVLAGMWLLERGRMGWAAFMFTAALSIKWQPALIAIFVVIYACDLFRHGSVTGQKRVQSLVLLGVGALPVVAVCLVAVSPQEIIYSFNRATGHAALSYQGLNPLWVLQYFQYQSAGLVGSGTEFYYQSLDPGLLVIAKRIFFVVYFGVVGLFAWRGRGFRSLLWFSLTGYLTYCVLNVGVHENHYFWAMILAIFIAARSSTSAVPMTVFIALSANLNLYLFYGQDGRSPFISPASGPATMMATVVLSLLNLGCLIICVLRCALHDFRSDAEPSASRPVVAS